MEASEKENTYWTLKIYNNGYLHHEKFGFDKYFENKDD